MDHAEQTSEEWSSLSGLYTAEEADFMSQLLGNCSVPEHHYENYNLEIPPSSWSGHESTVMSVSGINCSSYVHANANNSDTNFFGFSQGSSSITNCSNMFATTSGDNCCFDDPVANIGFMSIGDGKFNTFSVQGNENTDEAQEEVIGDKDLQAHKECEEPVSEPPEEDVTSSLEKSGKRSRSSMEVQKNKTTVKSRKKAKSAFVSNTEEDRNPGFRGQSLSSCCSEDDDSNELNGGGSSSLSQKDSASLKLKGKSRSDRGSATDPQSIYARRRREKINERLKILQNLVPNGTKVDISTMLEEAVQYVKFLQLQIKLLSSDDLWMYSPIAYNGMSLDLNITPAKQA